ncbi:MAG: hypothetical protein NTY61_02320 [Candidatus Parcubacteria bacterium]|nr:hypothetical protein [Candidatus Parcubacteria bacterium]
MNNIWKKDYKLKKQGGKVYLEIPTGVSSDSVKMILTQKPGERYWVISKVEGLVSSLFSAMENAQKEADNK